MPRERAALLEQRGRDGRRAGDPDAARRLSSSRSSSTSSRATRTPRPACSSSSGGSRPFTGRRDEAMARMERAFDVISDDEPDEDLALLAARLALGYWFSGDLERCGRAGRAGARHRRGTRVPGAAHARAAGEGGRRRQPRARRGGAWRSSSTRCRSRSTTTCPRTRASATSSSPTAASGATQYADALGYLDEALALARKVGNRPDEWAVLAERTYALYMLGRWDEALAASAEFTQEQIDSGGVVLSLLQSARRDPHPARRARRRAPRSSRCSHASRSPPTSRIAAVPRASLPAPGRGATAGGARRRRGDDRDRPHARPRLPGASSRRSSRRSRRHSRWASRRRSRSCSPRSRRFRPARGRRTSTPRRSASAPASRGTGRATRPPPSGSASSSPSGSRSRCSSTAS